MYSSYFNNKVTNNSSNPPTPSKLSTSNQSNYSLYSNNSSSAYSTSVVSMSSSTTQGTVANSDPLLETTNTEDILNAEHKVLYSNSINICPIQERKAGGSGLNALSASPDSRLIAVGGRKLFRIVRAVFAEDEKKFKLDIPITIYNSGKKSMDFAVVDLKWHPTASNLIASAPPNGKVILWQINSSSRNGRIVSRFSGHECTVNSICWQPNQENNLLSGSLDHTVKLWDKRQNGDNSALTFNCGSVVRSVKCNPFYNHVFASATDGGDFQVWDIRKPNVFQRRVPAHNGLIISLDWHPKKGSIIATGGCRDRIIKVWDLNDAKKPISTVQTIASIGKIAWRPGDYNTHLASCAKNDVSSTSNINLWDLNSRYVPLLNFTGQRADVTDIGWMNNYPNLMMSCSKDSTFMIHTIYESEYEKEDLPTTALNWNINNELIYVNDDIDRGQQQRYKTILETVAENPPSVKKQLNREAAVFHFKEQHIDRNINVIKSVDQNDPLFADADVSRIKYLAENYLLFGDDSFAQKCDRNAYVAATIQNYPLEKLWKIVKELHEKVEDNEPTEETSEEEDEKDKMELSNNSEHDEFILSNSNNSNNLFSDNEKYLFSSEDNFEPMSELNVFPSKGVLYSPINNRVNSDTFSPEEPLTESQTKIPLRRKTKELESTYDFPPPPKLCMVSEDKKLPTRIQSFDDLDGTTTVNKTQSNELESLYESTVQETIEYYAELGDIQTCVTLIEVLDKKQDMSGERELQWYLSYIELLNRHKLFTCSNEIINGCSNIEIHNLNKHSTHVRTSCGKCDSVLQYTDTVCRKCGSRTNTCEICHLPVDGLYFWCQRCGRGGHLHHMMDWFNKYKHCPVCLTHVSKLQTLT
ncbi:hypothetical protein ABK040_003346 [Willaertia magna]